MKQPPFNMAAYNFRIATEMAKRRISSLLVLAKKIETDPDKDKRLAVPECVSCYYSTRIGGAAMTTRPCGCCLQDVTYGSTATGAFCQACALKHDLCSRCGADMKLRNRRTWPENER